MTNRKIPATMVTQHPDHAAKPYWHTKEFINTIDEEKECFFSFSDLGTSECMWDWEGKLVDESIIERLLSKHFEFFQKNQLGKDKFLTFRIPDTRTKNEFRLGRVLMVLLSAAGFTKQIGLHNKPLFEVIMPMVETAEEMIAVQEAFKEISSLKHHLYRFGGQLKNIEIIPLFEQIDVIVNSDKILEQYVLLHQKKFGVSPTYIRPLLARSDPALSAGLVPAVLSTKIALSRYKKFEKRTGIKIFPIIGPGALPFRGGLNPNTVVQFSKEYSGAKTVLVQSAFRYDYQLSAVKKAISILEKTLPKGIAVSIPKSDEKKIEKINQIFSKYYQQTVENIASQISQMATFLPKRRERMNHVGLFGYSRSLKKKTLPRAIGFTGAMYSLGVPPEFLGMGRGLREIAKLGLLETLEKYYLFIKKDLLLAGGFLNKEILIKLATTHSSWNEVLLDVQEVENYLGQLLEFTTPEQIKHQKLTSSIYKKLKRDQDISFEIQQAAVLRKSIG